MKKKILIAGLLLTVAMCGCASKESEDVLEPVTDSAILFEDGKNMNEDVDDGETEEAPETDELTEESETSVDIEPIVISDWTQDENYYFVDYGMLERAYTHEDGSECASISFRIPRFKDSANVNSKVNDTILRIYEERLAEADSFFNTAVEDEDDADETFPEGHPTYSDNMDYEISYLSDKYACVYISGVHFSGGAHGWPYRITPVFDLQTGEIVNVSELSGLSADEFDSVFKDKFKQEFDKNSEEYWDDAVTMVNDTSFVESTDYFLTDEGVTYFFPPYSLSYYAKGYVEITASFDELKMEVE